MRLVLILLFAMLTGCTWGDSDSAGSSTGPGINVHCDAATPSGPTTVKVDCPPQ